MEILVPKHRRNPNERVQAIYSGVASGYRQVTTLWKPSADRNSMEATRVYGPPRMARGQGGLAGVLVLGGMEVTLDEIEDILAARQAKEWQPRRSGSEISEMCRHVASRRNELIEAARKQAGMAKDEPARPRPRRGLFLPRKYRYVRTSEPGLRILAKVA